VTRDEADPEELRRRLYAPGASTDDLDRYRTLAAATPSSDPTPRSDSARRAGGGPALGRRVRVLVAVAVVAVLAVVGGGLAAARSAARSAAEVPQATALRVDPEDRNSLQQSLAFGNYAGIAAYLVTHRSPPGLEGRGRYETVERKGIGNGRVVLPPLPPETVRGRASVLLVLASDGVAGWTAFRREVDSTGEQRYVRQARRSGPQPAGVLTTATFRYAAGDRPVELRIEAPEGVRWGVAIVFTD
jgi:hypothetical protein